MDTASVSMWATLLPVVVGAVIAIAGGLVTPLLLGWKGRRQERKVLTSCLKAEIAALLDIVERRSYLEDLRRLLAAAEAEPSGGAIYRFTFSVRSKPFQIYESNLGKLGLLEENFARRVVRFYSQGRSILEDIEDMRELKDETGEESLARLRELVPLFADTVALGGKITGWVPTEVGSRSASSVPATDPPRVEAVPEPPSPVEPQRETES